MRRYREPVAAGKKINWAIVKSLLPYLQAHKFKIFVALMLLVLAKLATIAMPFALKYLVDLLDNQHVSLALPDYLLAPVALIIAYGALRFFSTLFAELRDTLFNRVSERIIRHIGKQVFSHLLSLDYTFHLQRKTGALARDIERGTSGISFLLRFLVFNIVPTFLEIFLVINILLFNYGLAFAVVTGLAVVFYIGFSMIATNWRSQFIRDANRADSDANAHAVDRLLNYETVKYFTNEDHEVNQYDRALSKWEEAKNKNRLSLALLNSGQSLIISIAIISLLYLSANEVLDNTMTIGDFVLVNAFMMQLFMPLNFLGFVYREIRASLVNIEQMFNLLQVKPAIQDAKKALEYTIKDGAIRFENVFFTYPNCRPALNDVTFSVPAGAKIGIVGESGAGKSTITRLLFRFYDPEKGKITIDNIPITNMTLRSLRSQIAMVPQDCVLFNTSIIENIRYGRPDASDDEIYEVIRAAHLDKLIARLPDGVDTLVGERGLKLSGGEKQRIAIARAMLKRPRILVLDEATSSLDSESEEAILAELNEISKGITTLAIAHRLSTIADAECILVLQNGRIIEVGSHDDLLNQQGYYAKLWSIQKRNK